MPSRCASIYFASRFGIRLSLVSLGPDRYAKSLAKIKKRAQALFYRIRERAMRGKRFIHLFGTCAVLVPGAAAAQSVTPGTAADAYPGEIVVTAQKREQKLIDVPVAVTAISNAELASRGAAAIEDPQYSVPGMSITQFSPGQQRIQLRGISVFGGLPTVGVYLDELPLNGETNQMGQDVRLLDMQRVEVLRGPGGTLYGQGAMGGTVRYI